VDLKVQIISTQGKNDLIWFKAVGMIFMAAMGIKTIRESIGWRVSQSDIDATLDLSRAILFAKSAKKHGIQVIWTFMHYGTPDGVNLRDDSFITYFIEYARQVAIALAPFSDKPIYNLINEISFLSWAVAHTDHMHPYTDELDGFEMKVRLVKAVIGAIQAVKEVSPNARFLHVEPIMHVVPPSDRPELAAEAETFKSFQWQAFDLLKGTLCPEVGGRPEYLDLIGVNYYHNGQIELHGDALDWKAPDPRRIPFSKMLEDAWKRYRQPLIISETGHFDEGRAPWLDEVLSEVHTAKRNGIPIQGVCIYPVLDRPCWHEPEVIVRTGLIQATDSGRQYHRSSAKTILRWKKKLSL
jgi:beta-glucosidase/6-phospho-beta-glucosidase/beta-galactosidase